MHVYRLVYRIVRGCLAHITNKKCKNVLMWLLLPLLHHLETGYSTRPQLQHGSRFVCMLNQSETSIRVM